ncbi:hypothetical protein [Anditalea andensis]|nr:hypothetical protein [Anditalea andensis]
MIQLLPDLKQETGKLPYKEHIIFQGAFSQLTHLETSSSIDGAL